MIESIVEGALAGLLLVAAFKVHSSRVAQRMTDGQRDVILSIPFAVVVPVGILARTNDGFRRWFLAERRGRRGDMRPRKSRRA